MTKDQPLHTFHPTSRFSDRAADYAKFRPSYPSAAIDAMLEGLGPPASLLAADIGAGTGISSRLLADRGLRVTAIEPNAQMRQHSRPHPRVLAQDGTAEKTGLLDGAMDLVLCAQSFHWFKPAEALAEFRRILRAGGRLALMWNDKDQGDAATRGYTDAVARAAEGSTIPDRNIDTSALLACEHFGNVRTPMFPMSQRMSAEGLFGRATSASYVPRSGPRVQTLFHELQALHAKHQDGEGLIELRYITKLFLADAV